MNKERVLELVGSLINTEVLNVTGSGAAEAQKEWEEVKNYLSK